MAICKKCGKKLNWGFGVGLCAECAAKEKERMSEDFGDETGDSDGM